MFTGPSGCGKTTIARIIAKELGCRSPLELDAATYSGVDDMRSLREYALYQSLDRTPKVVIVDEVQAISKAAWQAALKIMEEPPEHAYFILCTTDSDKVPTTIKTRATAFSLKSVATEILVEYGTEVITEEKVQLPEGGLRYIVTHAQGSVRQLLVGLSLCEGAPDIAAVQRLLEQASSDDQLLVLSRMLVSGRRSFDRARKALALLREKGYEAEAVRIGIIEYVSAVFYNSEETRKDLMSLLDLLYQPLPQRGGWAGLAVMIYRAIEPNA